MDSPKWISYELYVWHSSAQDSRLTEIGAEDHWDFVMATTSEEDVNRQRIRLINRGAQTKVETTIVDGGEIFCPN